MHIYSSTYAKNTKTVSMHLKKMNPIRFCCFNQTSNSFWYPWLTFYDDDYAYIFCYLYYNNYISRYDPIVLLHV